MLSAAYRYPGPASVRYPRGAGVGAQTEASLDGVELAVAPAGGAFTEHQVLELVAVAHAGPQRFHPLLVAGHPRQEMPRGPAAIAIHDDGDVLGDGGHGAVTPP